MSWRALLQQWELVEQDLADIGVDVWDKQLMRTRPWVWLEVRITGLLTRPVVYAPSGAPIYRTRVGRHFFQQAALEAAARANQRR